MPRISDGCILSDQQWNRVKRSDSMVCARFHMHTRRIQNYTTLWSENTQDHFPCDAPSKDWYNTLLLREEEKERRYYSKKPNIVYACCCCFFVKVAFVVILSLNKLQGIFGKMKHIEKSFKDVDIDICNDKQLRISHLSSQVKTTTLCAIIGYSLVVASFYYWWLSQHWRVQANSIAWIIYHYWRSVMIVVVEKKIINLGS